MTTQEQGFLEAICADPHDDAVRLIYADWLQDHGEGERAEFIRVQVELATANARQHQGNPQEQTKPCPACVHYEALRRRERELLRAHYWPWIIGIKYLCIQFKEEDPLSTVAVGLQSSQVVNAELTFRRGFVESVSCTCAVWLKHGPAIVRAQPVLEVKLVGLHTLMDTGMTAEEMTGLCEHPVEWARASHPSLTALPPLC